MMITETVPALSAKLRLHLDTVHSGHSPEELPPSVRAIRALIDHADGLCVDLEGQPSLIGCSLAERILYLIAEAYDIWL